MGRVFAFGLLFWLIFAGSLVALIILLGEVSNKELLYDGVSNNSSLIPGTNLTCNKPIMVNESGNRIVYYCFIDDVSPPAVVPRLLIGYNTS